MQAIRILPPFKCGGIWEVALKVKPPSQEDRHLRVFLVFSSQSEEAQEWKANQREFRSFQVEGLWKDLTRALPRGGEYHVVGSCEKLWTNMWMDRIFTSGQISEDGHWLKWSIGEEDFEHSLSIVGAPTVQSEGGMVSVLYELDSKSYVEI